MADLKKGDRVRILVDTPQGEPLEGTVAVVQDKPGKQVGVELDNFVATGHSLDGKTSEAEKVDQSSGVTYGKGWWTLADNVEKLS